MTYARLLGGRSQLGAIRDALREFYCASRNIHRSGMRNILEASPPDERPQIPSIDEHHLTTMVIFVERLLHRTLVLTRPLGTAFVVASSAMILGIRQSTIICPLPSSATP